MSKFQQFFKQNKIKKANVKYPATNSLLDENGKPLEWTIRPLTTTESDIIKKECIYYEKENGEKVQRFDMDKYLCKISCACIVEPNLYDKELQDSYGVMTPEELLKSMIDNPIEYEKLKHFIDEYNGIPELNDKVEEAKN